MIYLFAIFFGVLIGLTLGFFGSGGSILAVPILVYILKIETKSAVAMSLAIVGTTALIGAVQQLKQKQVHIKTALVVGSFGIISAYLGSRLAFLLTGHQQLFIFGAVMFIASINMLNKAMKDQPITNHLEDAPHISFVKAASIGSVVGLLTGIIGVGGGFLIVPALIWAGLSIHHAIGTSLVIIVMNASSGIIGYLGSVDFHPDIILAFLTSSLISSVIGAKLSKKVPVKKMKMGFAIFLIVMAIVILVKNTLESGIV